MGDAVFGAFEFLLPEAEASMRYQKHRFVSSLTPKVLHDGRISLMRFNSSQVKSLNSISGSLSSKAHGNSAL